MAKVKKVERPAKIDQYKEYDAGEKEFKDKKDSIKEEVRSLLHNSDYPDVRLVEVNTEKLDAEKAMKWAKKNLEPEQFKSLFVKLFDVNAFSNMIKEGHVNKQTMMKLEILTKTTRHDIRVYHDKGAE
jgi:hypothetical protein